MTDSNRRFSIITLHPHWAQYIISQGMAFLISCTLFLTAGHESITYKMPFVVLGAIMTCIMLYGCLYLHKLSYIITSEQLIIMVYSSGRVTTLNSTGWLTSVKTVVSWNSCSD